jgi:hypothetical protein
VLGVGALGSQVQRASLHCMTSFKTSIPSPGPLIAATTMPSLKKMLADSRIVKK